MSYGFKILVEGDYACFTRPEMKTERVSYDVMTPPRWRAFSSARLWCCGMYTMSSTRTSTRRTPLRPATIPASFRTLSSDGWKRGSVTACRISARGSFPRSSGAARNCRRAPMSSKARATSAGCCGISTTAILRTSRRSFSARALSTA